jgi:cyclopropane-fatty-acyl-phospholipid synthase
MIDHLCSPAQANQGMAIEIYRQYFKKCAELGEARQLLRLPGHPAQPRAAQPEGPRGPEVHRRRDLPGRPQPAPRGAHRRREPLLGVVELRTQRTELRQDHRRVAAPHAPHEKTIREKWGDQVFDDYDRYLSTCVRAFENHWSSDVQMKLRRCD